MWCLLDITLLQIKSVVVFTWIISAGQPIFCFMKDLTIMEVDSFKKACAHTIMEWNCSSNEKSFSCEARIDKKCSMHFIFNDGWVLSEFVYNIYIIAVHQGIQKRNKPTWLLVLINKVYCFYPDWFSHAVKDTANYKQKDSSQMWLMHLSKYVLAIITVYMPYIYYIFRNKFCFLVSVHQISTVLIHYDSNSIFCTF